MKIVFFTNKNPDGIEILKAIYNAKIPILAIIIENSGSRSIKADLKRFKGRTIKEKLKIILKIDYHYIFLSWLRKGQRLFIPEKKEEWSSNEYFKSFSDSIISIDNFNSKECETIIKDFTPDIIVIGGARIIKNNIIKIPKIGIINAHPGLLPKYRGIDVIPWAIFNGDDVGVTVHFIDEGVDTGKICVQKKLPLMKNDNLNTLAKRANFLKAELVLEVLQLLIKDGKCQTFPNPKEKGTQFYAMDAKTRHTAEKRLEERLKNGRKTT